MTERKSLLAFLLRAFIDVVIVLFLLYLCVMIPLLAWKG